MAMDKYGVYTGTSPTNLDKQAQAEICPSCGHAVEYYGSVKMCAKCGSKPFESRTGIRKEADLSYLRKGDKP